MGKRLMDRDPLTGVETWFDYDQSTDRMTLTYSQDVSKALKYAEGMRQISDERTRKQIKQDWVHYAVLPPSIQLEMLYKHKVDPMSKHDRPRLFSLINTVYPKFKVTEITHNERSK